MKSTAGNVVLNLYTNVKLFRNIITSNIDKRIFKSIVETETDNLKTVQRKKYDYLSALLYSIKRNIGKKYISKNFIKNVGGFIASLEVSCIHDKDPARDNSSFISKYGMDPPMFIVLSPTQRCNLNCIGCYAASNAKTAATLPYDIVDKIIAEVHDSFNGRFVTISGGEPFMYQSDGKTLIDIFRKYDDMFFLVYTNGTLIDEELANTIAELGNVTPAVSIEGTEEQTDKRRGKGTSERILKGFENLRNAGVPFGLSITATNHNINTVLDEKFYDYCFDELGATYMWQFQFMPIGRGKETFDLVVKPQDRIKMYRMWERMLSEKKYCIADFWNSGVLTHGCIAYGANRGYIYIDWNGNIMPCVFVPYYEDNVYDVYKNGKTLGDALFSGLMKKGNKWQIDYALKDKKKPGNWLMPCSIRDHYENFRKNILNNNNIRGENLEAQEILNDEEYYNNMIKYDEELKKLTEDIWEKEYLNGS